MLAQLLPSAARACQAVSSVSLLLMHIWALTHHSSQLTCLERIPAMHAAFAGSPYTCQPLQYMDIQYMGTLGHTYTCNTAPAQRPDALHHSTSEGACS